MGMEEMASPDSARSRSPGTPEETKRNENLLAQVYEQLRAIARHRIASEAPGHTLQATALVHEAYMKLCMSGSGFQLNDKSQFVIMAAEAMRRVLIDHARGRNRVKRGGGVARRALADVA